MCQPAEQKQKTIQVAIIEIVVPIFTIIDGLFY